MTLLTGSHDLTTRKEADVSYHLQLVCPFSYLENMSNFNELYKLMLNSSLTTPYLHIYLTLMYVDDEHVFRPATYAVSRAVSASLAGHT